MENRCENCGQTVLPTDSVCWQCGWRPPAQVKAASSTANQTAVTAEAETPISVTAVSVYATLTLLIILLLLLLFNALGKYPVILLDPRAPIKPGWQLLTDHRQTFTLELPPGWEWAEDDIGSRQAAFMNKLAENPQYNASLTPWIDIAGDLEVLLAADSPQNGDADGVPGFLLIGRSGRLKQLNSEQVLALWQSRLAEENLVSTALGKDLHGGVKETAVINLQPATESVTCRQEIVSGVEYRYLVVVCSPSTTYENHAREYEIMLSSFQLLTPPS